MPKRKHEAVVDQDAPEQGKNSRSVLGGMSGGYRMLGNELIQGEGDTGMIEIPVQDKTIVARRMGRNDDAKEIPLALIFTHGAGGGIDTPATKLFALGFAISSGILIFQGSMNLQSRFKSFKAVIEHENWGEALGGSSMGARAAVMTAQEDKQTKALVLASYPLTSKKDVRDKILLDLRKGVDVLFISGDGDEMCDIKHLNQIRKKMKAKSWLVVVHGADHGMSLKPKSAVEKLRESNGRIAAEWLKRRDIKKTEMSVRWEEEKKELEQSEWQSPTLDDSKPTVKKQKKSYN